MEEKMKSYPLGIQTFKEVVTGNYVYVDKTEYVYKLANGLDKCKYVFLSRPRRFGKSLLVSTFKSYFEGDKELFKGLAISKLEKDWIKYPVLHFDMSLGKHMDKEQLNRYLLFRLGEVEKKYGMSNTSEDPNVRLTQLITDVYEKYNQKVVVLIDEYDAPLLDVMNEEKDLPVLRNVMRNFYSPLKACDPYLRFVFLTGITKFSQLSIFSELNNIKNISIMPEYAAICGISEDEMKTQMKVGIKNMAANLQITEKELLARLKKKYDGYHFTIPSPDIYNPYSLLNAFHDKKLDSYWFGSGTPTYLIEMLNKFKVLPQDIGNRKCAAEDFDSPTDGMTDITPLLYQSGYITIKNYSAFSGLYTLSIPNTEVRIGLMKSLLINYVKRPAEINTLVGEMAEKIHFDDMGGALELMKTVFSSIPYCNVTNHEGHYQQLIYIIFTLLGNFMDLEANTSMGRVDCVMRAPDKLYLMEIKLDKPAGEALSQIDIKNYSERFALLKLPIVKVGISFDTKAKTLKEWKIA